MKKLIKHTLAAFAALALAAGAYAQSIDANGTLTFPEGTTETGVRAFVSNTEITSVVFPASLKTISNYSFMGCTNLKEVVIPSTVTTIGTSAFNGSGVRSVEIEEGCKSIGGYAFNGCKSLVRLVIPSTVTSIGASSVPSSARIECPKGSYAEQWARENDMTLVGDFKLENGVLIIAEGVEILSNSQYITEEMSEIAFPQSLKIIGNNCFGYCPNIKFVNIPNGTTTLGNNAFGHCVNLRKIIVPPSVSSIGTGAICLNTTMVVEEGSYAHQWAIDNNRDYQFSEEGLPVGVTEVYKDYFTQTAWNQRGGQNQFAPLKRYIVCGNLANVTILYHLGLKYQGSTCFATKEGTYYLNMDENPVDYDNIPLIFYAKSLDKMVDADMLLFQQGMVYKLDWLRDEQGKKYPGWLQGMMEHAPAKITSYDNGDYTEAQCEEMLKRNFAAGRPVWMWTRTVGNAHAFVIDGLRIKNDKVQVHCNFGFTGDHDGWYNLWEQILGFDDPFRHFVEWVPLEGEELANWKPFRLTQEQIDAIHADTSEVTTIVDGLVHVPEGNNYILPKEFQDNTTVTQVELPLSLRAIGTSAFSGCVNLSEVTIPKYTEQIQGNAFANTGIRQLALNERLVDILQGAFMNCKSLQNFVLTDNIKVINKDVFSGCSSITEITIPARIQKIDQRAFKNCTNLQTVHFNAVASAISGTGVNSAFYGCSNLKKVVVGEGVTTIPPQIFLQCTALETIELPASVIEINTNPFPKTTKVICPEGSYAEQWALANGYKLADEQLIKDSMLTLPEGLKEIAADMYANRTDFNALVIPSTVTKIGQRAFKNCTDLQTIYFNAILSSIAGEKENAPFAGCTGLRKVVVGEGCTKISRTIFSQCTALDTIEIPASVTTIGDNPFPKTTTVVCPAGSYAEQWARENGYSVVLLSADSGIDDHAASRPIIVEGGHVSSTVDGLRIFNLLGQDVTHLNGSLRGIYIVRIGGEVTKVVVK